MRKSKRIGILGGMGPESTVEFYRLIIKKYVAIHNDYAFPEIVIFSVNLKTILDLQEKIIEQNKKNDRVIYIAKLMNGIHSLENAGVDFIVIASNTPHMVFKDLEADAKVPLLSIVRNTARKAISIGLKKLLLLGTKYTMQSNFYQTEFKAENIEVVVPFNTEQETLNGILLEELVRGVFKDRSRQQVVNIIENYPVDGVILGSTEFPLLIHQKDVRKVLLDTLDIHADATLSYAMG